MYIIWKRTIKSLDKFTCSVFSSAFRLYDRVKVKKNCCAKIIFVRLPACAKVPVSQDAKHYLSFISLAKFMFPKSLEAGVHCFHTSCFIIIGDLWGVQGSSRGLLSSAPVLQTSQLCIQSLSVLLNLEPWVKSEVFIHSLWSGDGVFKVRASWESLTRISSALCNWENKPLSAQICSSVNDEGQLYSEILTRKESLVQSCDKRVSSTNGWSIISIPCGECMPIGGATALHSGKGSVRIKERLFTSKSHTKLIPRMWLLYFYTVR